MPRSRRIGRPGTLIALMVAVLLATASPARAATVVAQWAMDDTVSPMVDATGRGHTGTLHHVTVGRPGFSGTAFKFSGEPSYVKVSSAGDFSPGSGNFQFSVNVRFASPPSPSVGDYDLVRRGLGSTSGGSYKMEILRSGRAYCDFRGSSGEVTLSKGPNLADNEWHTITCARKGTSVVLTVDGRSWSASGRTGTISQSSVALYIGARDSSGGDQYTGSMDALSFSKG